jgi:hypothetical protein
MTDFQRGAIWVAVSSKKQAEDDKISLKMQEDLGRAWMNARGIHIVAVLIVPGHTRAESDVVDALEEFRAHKITAYDDLRALWKAKAFDVLWAFDHSRFGRSNSLHSFVIENVVNSGAEIVLHQGGDIDTGSLRSQIAIGGFQVSSHGDHLRAKNAVAFPALAQRGLPHGAHFWTHRVVRDDRGKAVKLVPNEARLPLFHAMIDLFLTGLAWGKIGPALAEKGFTQNNGKHWPETTIRRTFYHPHFWGHTGYRYHGTGVAHGQKFGFWTFDASEPLPPGTEIYRDTIPAIAPPDKAEAIKAELRSRNEIQGPHSNASAHMFDYVIFCAVCKRHLVHRTSKDSYGARNTRYYYVCHLPGYVQRRKPCANRRHVRFEAIRQEVDRIMRECVDEDVFAALEAPVTKESELQITQRGINDVEQRLRTLIMKQAEQPLVADIYAGPINQLGQEREGLKRRLIELERQEAQRRNTAAERSEVLKELREMNIDEFWTRPQPEINQYLLRLFGEFCLISNKEAKLGLARRPSRE